MSLLSKQKDMESELAAARERLQQQATELVLKASRWFMYWAYMMESQQNKSANLSLNTFIMCHQNSITM